MKKIPELHADLNALKSRRIAVDRGCQKMSEEWQIVSPPRDPPRILRRRAAGHLRSSQQSSWLVRSLEDHVPSDVSLQSHRIVSLLSLVRLILHPRPPYRLSLIRSRSPAMVRRRACDGCSLRKTRCSGGRPCQNCARAGFECTYVKIVSKPGPKGPRPETYVRINKRLRDLRDRAASGDPSSLANGNNNARSSSELADTTHSSSSASTSTASPPLLVGGELSLAAEWESHFSLADVLSHLEIYKQRMYPVWPVIDAPRLGSRLMQDTNNCEICALAFAVCAATSTQLQLHPESHQPTDGIGPSQTRDERSMADRFAVESERYRAMYDYRESNTLEAVLVPLFLHFHYSSKRKVRTSSLLLREAVSLCQLLGLDREDTYQYIDPEQERYRRRTFWLLYLTERGHGIQHDINTCLTNSIRLPERDHLDELQLVEAFDTLVGLFISVEGVLLVRNGPATPKDGVCSKEVLSRLQNQLRQQLQWSAAYNALQRTDIAITQQWLRVLLWQLSLKNIYLSSGSADDSMCLTYPVHVARDAMQFVSTMPLDAFMAHGTGMEIKLFEIASTLLDVICCVPSTSHNSTPETRDMLHRLCCLLSSLSHRPYGLEVLQKKLDESGIPHRFYAPLPPAVDDPTRAGYQVVETFDDNDDDNDENAAA